LEPSQLRPHAQSASNWLSLAKNFKPTAKIISNVMFDPLLLGAAIGVGVCSSAIPL
jgi:threonine/homoserine efflux transporter RhtA